MIQLYIDSFDIYENTVDRLRNTKYGYLVDYVHILVSEVYPEESHQFPYKCR